MKQDTSRNDGLVTVWIRWIARTWGVASTLLLLAFAFGGHEHLRFTTREAALFLLFPVGVIAGFMIAWWRELAGGLVTVGSFLLFSVMLLEWSGRWPGIYFYLFVAPGFLHIASAMLARRNAAMVRSAGL
jgi:hypothetical protein